MTDPIRNLAVVTGASTGIGLELARQCAKNGYDLLIAADEAEIETAADELRREGGNVETVQADLATLEGVDELLQTRLKVGTSMRFSPMLDVGWGGRSWIKISKIFGASSTPISPARSISFTKSAATCARRGRAAF